MKKHLIASAVFFLVTSVAFAQVSSPIMPVYPGPGTAPINGGDGAMTPSAGNAASAAAANIDNAGGITATGGNISTKLKARFSHVLNAVDDFGADPTGVADSTTALQNLANGLGATAAGYVPCGTYKVSTAITISAENAFLSFADNCAIIRTTSATADVFTISNAFVTLQGPHINSSVPRTAGNFINFTSVRGRLYDFYLDGAYVGVRMAGTDTYIDRGWVLQTVAGGKGIVGTGGALALAVGLVVMDGDAGAQPTAGIYFDNVGDVYLAAGSQIIHQGTGLLAAPGNGQSITSLATGGVIYFDNNGTRSIDLCPTGTGVIQRSRFDNPWASSAGSNGIRVCSGVTGVDFVNPHVFLNGSDGVRIAGGSQVWFLGGEYAQNTGWGFSVAADISNFSIVGGKFGAISGLTANSSGGVIVQNGSGDYYQITGNNFVSQSSAISDGGAGTHKNVFGNPGDQNDYRIYREVSSGALVISGVQASFSGYKFSDNDGTVRATIGNGGSFLLPGLASSSAATTGTLCWTTGTGNVNVDTTVACLASDERLKTISAALSDPLTEVGRLKPITYRWNDGTPKAKDDPGDHIGLGAFATAYVDERLVARDDQGNPRGWRQDAMIALLVGAIQQQNDRIDTLEKRLSDKP